LEKGERGFSGEFGGWPPARGMEDANSPYDINRLVMPAKRGVSEENSYNTRK
jgi:hypothetical protein